MINLFLIVYDFSGAKTYADELASYLEYKKEINVFKLYLHYKNSKEFKVEGKKCITNVYIPAKIAGGYDKKYYIRAAQLIYIHFQNLQNIILHANAPEQFDFVKEAKRFFRCPVVFTFHFLEKFISHIDYEKKYHEEHQIRGNVLPGMMLTFSDQIICVTEFAKRAVEKYYKIDPDKASTIYNGRQGQNKVKKTYSKTGLKVKYGFNPNDLILLFAGPLQARKGIDALIKAFYQVKNDYPTLKLVIAGSGEYDIFFPLAQNCPGRIFFTGQLDYDKLTDFYRLADIGIIPSQYEQGGYVTIEMIQNNLPIVVTNVPGLNEMIIHDITGQVCKVLTNNESLSLEADVVDLAKQIKFFLDNPLQASQISNKAKLESRDRFSLDSMGESTYKVYQKLIQSNSFYRNNR
jgi:glycosyltransferase involved in cell wall biosynthesis